MIPTKQHTFDVVVIGTGGAGLMAALKAAKSGLSVACISKVFPTRSHTTAAQGGINAALGNLDQDQPSWHTYDTIRGSDWLADQDAVELMCQAAPLAIKELEHYGVPFSRHSNGKLDQRIYGGQSSDFGKGEAPHRACFSQDRTGHAILHTLYQQALAERVVFFNDHIALDLLTDQTQCYGTLALDPDTGIIRIFHTAHIIIATGGYGQIYQTTTSSSICTGDGTAMVARAGFALQDMEFIQFHPTGIYGHGILISEAARAEGAFLTNADGHRFMQDAAPRYLELAPRDVICRAIAKEIAEGRGCGTTGDYVHLELQHLDPQHINQRLPEIKQLASTYAHIDVHQHPIPVTPSVHYTMGGIPTSLNGQVLNRAGTEVIGLYAIGEAACISVHGANRLGCNSLLDLIVFASQAIAHINEHPCTPTTVKTHLVNEAITRFNQTRHMKGSVPPHLLRRQIQDIMSRHAGIFRHESTLKEGIAKLTVVLSQCQQLAIPDSSLIWNNSLLEALEVQHMAHLAWITLHTALHRTESRGAHYRDDFSERNDTQWLCHSLCHLDANNHVNISTRPVRMHLFEPEQRNY